MMHWLSNNNSTSNQSQTTKVHPARDEYHCSNGELHATEYWNGKGAKGGGKALVRLNIARI